MNKKFIDILAINRVLQGIKTELDKGYSTKHNLLDVLEATKKINGANIKLVNAEGVTFNKLFDGTTDIAISASEIGTNTKAEDTALLAGKVNKVEGKQLSAEDYSTVEKTKLVGIEANANNYTHPSTHSATEIVTDSNRGFVTDIEKVSWTDKYTKSETDAKIAVMTDAIEWKAAVATFEDIATTYPEPQDGWVVNVNDTDITYRYTGTEWIEISANSIPVATTTVDGKMSKIDKAKIDGIEVGANLYVHPESHPATIVVESPTHRFVTDALKTSYGDKNTKVEFDDKALTKVDIANCATPDEVDELFLDLFPRPHSVLRLEIAATHVIKLNLCLKSWGRIKFNGEVVESIPLNTAGVVEIEDAVALDVYNYSANFGIAFGDYESALIALSGFLDTSNVTNMSYMFYGCGTLTTLDFSNLDTSNVTDMSYMFYGCGTLTTLDLSNLDTSNVTDMSCMFYDCGTLTTLDLSNLDTSNVTDMSNMFYGCGTLTSLDLSNFDTSNVTDMNSMFYDCGTLTTLDLSNLDTSNVTSMSYMFSGCGTLTTLDLSNLDTSSVTNMSGMFYGCGTLTTLDLSNLDTSNVTNMSCMFYDCGTLTTLDLSNLDTSNVTDMSNMFYGCGTLTTLDLSNLDTSNVTDMSHMFRGCGTLTTLDLSKFDTSKVRYMASMFENCSVLTTLDLSNFDTSKVQYIDDMFSGCGSITNVDLSGTNVLRGTIEAVSSRLASDVPSQTIIIRLSDHTKHDGLSYPNITYDCGGCPEPEPLVIEI